MELENRSKEGPSTERVYDSKDQDGTLKDDTRAEADVGEGSSYSVRAMAGPSRSSSSTHPEDIDVDEFNHLESREERRSPASVFGSKRIGSVVLPMQLIDGIQKQIDGKQHMISSFRVVCNSQWHLHLTHPPSPIA